LLICKGAFTQNLTVPKIVFIPFFLIFSAIFGLGIGLWTATLMVRYRDVHSFVRYGLQVLKYATPIAYSSVLIPENWSTFYRLNPMYWVIEGFRWSLLGTGQAPERLMIYVFIFAFVFLIFGMFVFRRTERNIVDWL